MGELMKIRDIDYKFNYVRIDMDFPREGSRSVYVEFARFQNGVQIGSQALRLEQQDAVDFYYNYNSHTFLYEQLCEQLGVEFPGGVDENEYGVPS